MPFILIAIVILFVIILSVVLVILKILKRNEDKVIINPETTIIETNSVVMNEVSPCRDPLPV